jgi:hypothetical protein
MADEIVAKELARDTSSGTIARLSQTSKKFKALFADAIKERNSARVELAKVQADLVEAKKAGSAVEELAALKLKVRLDGHRSKFNELAKAAGAHDRGLNDLWEKSGYAADGDTPDEKTMARLIAKQKEERDYLFESPAGDGTEVNPADLPPEPEAARPGPGRGRGGHAPANGSQTQVTDAQLRDPAWCMANQAKLQQVAKDVASLPVSQVTGRFAIL